MIINRKQYSTTTLTENSNGVIGKKKAWKENSCSIYKTDNWRDSKEVDLALILECIDLTGERNKKLNRKPTFNCKPSMAKGNLKNK